MRLRGAPFYSPGIKIFGKREGHGQVQCPPFTERSGLLGLPFLALIASTFTELFFVIPGWPEPVRLQISDQMAWTDTSPNRQPARRASASSALGQTVLPFWLKIASCSPGVPRGFFPFLGLPSRPGPPNLKFFLYGLLYIKQRYCSPKPAGCRRAGPTTEDRDLSRKTLKAKKEKGNFWTSAGLEKPTAGP